MTRQFRVALGLVVCGVGTSWAEDIRPHFEKGAERYYVRRVDTREVQKIEVEGIGDIPERHITSEIGLKVKVLDSGADGAMLECTVLYADRSEVQGDKSTTFDSRKGAGGEKAAWTSKIRNFLNKSYKLTLDTTGAVTQVEGLPEAGRSGYNPFEDIFSDTAFQHLPIFATAGAGASAKVGDLWKQKFETTLAMSDSSITEEVEYKLDKLGEAAEIGVQAKFSASGRSSGSFEGGKVMQVKGLEGARQGKIVWNVGEADCAEYRSETKMSYMQVMPGAEGKGMKVERHFTDALKPAKLEDFKLRTPLTKPKTDDKKESPKEDPTGGE